MHKIIVQGINEVSRGEVVEKEVVSRKALNFNKDISEQDVVKTGAEEGKVEGREILRRFLEFTKFPEKYRDPMIEKFFEEAM